ncbi:MAG: hypothetical protein H7Y22_14585, partial [Gemmatimonadaceae bacterium]|nr:hypothetical protein [Gloeobacterales cyanobacterium ES-bin-141]
MDLEQLKAKLKAQKLGVGVEQLGNRLYLAATLPPKPGASRTRPFQQRIALGVYSNPAGLKRAEAEARMLSGLIASNRFDWGQYLKTEPLTVQAKTFPGALWVERFREDYFSKRALTQASATTWRTNFHQVFIQLDPTAELTAGLEIFERDLAQRVHRPHRFGAMRQHGALDRLTERHPPA